MKNNDSENLSFHKLEKTGTQASPIDLKNINTEQLVRIKEELSREGFILFKNQALDDKDLILFGKQIGNGHLEASAFSVNHGKKIKEVGYITNLKRPDGSPLGNSLNTTDFWHSDQEFRESPASIGILFCLIPSDENGQTSFASTSLSLVKKEKIEKIHGLWSTRKPAAVHDNAPRITVSHPTILQNPYTHKEYVYISENTIDFFDPDYVQKEFDKYEILNDLLTPDKVYSHEWKPGDLILYDNAQLLHRREKYEGLRFLKALKIYPDSQYNIVIDGKIIS